MWRTIQAKFQFALARNLLLIIIIIRFAFDVTDSSDELSVEQIQRIRPFCFFFFNHSSLSIEYRFGHGTRSTRSYEIKIGWTVKPDDVLTPTEYLRFDTQFFSSLSIRMQSKLVTELCTY